MRQLPLESVRQMNNAFQDSEPVAATHGYGLGRRSEDLRRLPNARCRRRTGRRSRFAIGRGSRSRSNGLRCCNGGRGVAIRLTRSSARRDVGVRTSLYGTVTVHDHELSCFWQEEDDGGVRTELLRRADFERQRCALRGREDCASRPVRGISMSQSKGSWKNAH